MMSGERGPLGRLMALMNVGVTEAATKLVFGDQPSHTNMGATISAITVEAQDADSVLIESYTGEVTIAIDTNPGSGTLSGTLTVNAVAGIATFDDLSIDNYEDDYTLAVTADDLTGATSAEFDIYAIVVQDNLLAWWKHDEGAGTDLIDHKGSYDGVIQGANFWDNNGPDSNPVGTYNGSTNLINGIGTGLGWSGTDSRTFVVAFRTNSVGAAGDPKVLISRTGNVAAEINLLIQQTRHIGGEEDEFRLGYYGNTAVQNWKTTNFNLSVDTWYIATFQMTMGTPANIKVYRNLTLCTGAWASGDGVPVGASVVKNTQIGDRDINEDDSGSPAGAKTWGGRMGDVLIYDGILSLAEITQNFEALKDRFSL